MKYVINDKDGDPIKTQPRDELPKIFNFETAALTIRKIWINKGFICEGSRVVEYD